VRVTSFVAHSAVSASTPFPVALSHRLPASAMAPARTSTVAPLISPLCSHQTALAQQLFSCFVHSARTAAALSTLLPISSRSLLLRTPPPLTPWLSGCGTTGGLYERARKKYSLSDGIRLFHYSFFRARRTDAQVRKIQ
jgi:hypothetical protein